MSQRHMEAHYKPNWELTQAHGLLGYNCGYAASPRCESFDEHQQSLVWHLLGDTPIGPESTVLDVGCGIGGPSGWIFNRYHPRRLIGLEYLGSSVAAAHERWQRVERRPLFIQGDAHRLPVDDGSVDVIFNLESALHYADKGAFIAECCRVLKPGGTLCLGDITTRRKLFFAPLHWLNRLPSQFNSNVHLWSAEDYRAAFGRCGLDVMWHEDAAPHVAVSLEDGRRELRRHGFWKTLHFRSRMVFLQVLEYFLRGARLNYDLFRVQKPDASGPARVHQ